MLSTSSMVRKCFWGKWQKGELYWSECTDFFNSILAHWYMKSLVCFCFLFTVQENFTLVKPRNVLPPTPNEDYFPIQKDLLRKWKYEKRDKKVKVRPLYFVKRSWEDFLIFLEGKSDKLRMEQVSSKITSLVFQGNITLFPLHARWCQQHFWGMWWLPSNNAVSQLPATGHTCGLTAEDQQYARQWFDFHLLNIQVKFLPEWKIVDCIIRSCLSDFLCWWPSCDVPDLM